MTALCNLICLSFSFRGINIFLVGVGGDEPFEIRSEEVNDTPEVSILFSLELAGRESEGNPNAEFLVEYNNPVAGLLLETCETFSALVTPASVPAAARFVGRNALF